MRPWELKQAISAARACAGERNESAFLETIQSYKSDDAFSAQSCSEIAASSLLADGIDRGAVAGNGGEMAEGKKQTKKTMQCVTAKSKAVRKPRKKLVAKTTSATVEIVPAGDAVEQGEPSITVDPNVDGELVLCNSVNRQIAVNATKIAVALVKRTEEGNATCGRFLFDLMRQREQRVKSRSKSMSRFIDMLESELEPVKPDTNDVKQTQGSNG